MGRAHAKGGRGGLFSHWQLGPQGMTNIHGRQPRTPWGAPQCIVPFKCSRNPGVLLVTHPQLKACHTSPQPPPPPPSCVLHHPPFYNSSGFSMLLPTLAPVGLALYLISSCKGSHNQRDSLYQQLLVWYEPLTCETGPICQWSLLHQ